MTVAAWEIHRFVTVVPTHPIVLAAARARDELYDLTLAPWLADVGALNDDPVTSVGVHGEPPFRGLPSPSTHTALHRGRLRLPSGHETEERRDARILESARRPPSRQARTAIGDKAARIRTPGRRRG
jgi:hypothetical protein